MAPRGRLKGRHGEGRVAGIAELRGAGTPLTRRDGNGARRLLGAERAELIGLHGGAAIAAPAATGMNKSNCDDFLAGCGGVSTPLRAIETPIEISVMAPGDSVHERPFAFAEITDRKPLK